MNDLKFAFRQLLKNPGFTVRPSRCRFGGQAVAVLVLALDIGANTATSPQSARQKAQSVEGLGIPFMPGSAIKGMRFSFVSTFHTYETKNAESNRPGASF